MGERSSIGGSRGKEKRRGIEEVRKVEEGAAGQREEVDESKERANEENDGVEETG